MKRPVWLVLIKLTAHFSSLITAALDNKMKVNILIAATCHADVTQSRHPSTLISACEVSEVLFASFSPFCLDGSSGWRRQLLEK